MNLKVEHFFNSSMWVYFPKRFYVKGLCEVKTKSWGGLKKLSTILKSLIFCQMKQTRRKFWAAFKDEIALKVIIGVKTFAEVAQHYEINSV